MPVSALSDFKESSEEQEFGVGFPPSSDSGKSNDWCNSGVGSLSASGEFDGYMNCGVGSPSGPLSSSEGSDRPRNFGVGSPLDPLSSSGELDGPGTITWACTLRSQTLRSLKTPVSLGRARTQCHFQIPRN